MTNLLVVHVLLVARVLIISNNYNLHLCSSADHAKFLSSSFLSEILCLCYVRILYFHLHHFTPQFKKIKFEVESMIGM